MKLKIIGGLISFLLIILTILLFVDSESVIRIIVSPKSYSLLKSSDNETINITILANDTDTYYFNEEYISKMHLSTDGEEIVPLLLIEVNKTNDLYFYDYEEYNYVDFVFEIGFDSEDYLISMDKAFLNITYSNGETLELFIGEFNYYFMDTFTNDIGVSDLLATNRLINNVDTASGLFLKLDNLSDHNIIINKVEIGSNSVKANNFHLKEIFNEVDYSNTPEEILQIDEYNYEIYGDVSQNILLRQHNSIMLYIPFSYIGDISYLYRFYCEVYYEVDGVENVFIIDDFPFIYTSNYKVELESDYVHYEYSN